jgi:hypothetical protein
MERIRKHRTFLQQLIRGKRPAQRTQLIRQASNAQLCVVCELVKNLLHNGELNIKLTDRQRRQLRKHRTELEALIDRKVPSKSKRKILQKGRGFLLPLLLGLVGPVVSRLISKL